MDRRVQEVRRGAARLELKTTGRRYPAELRELAVASAREHVALGGAVSGAAAALGVPAQTLTYWMNKTSGCSALVRVEVEREEPRAASSTIAVTLPCGTVVSGVTAAEAVFVVRGLR